MINHQLAAQGWIHQQVPLVDAPLIQAARRAPASSRCGRGDADADYMIKAGQPHYGYKAHVAVDEPHTLIRRAELSAASMHDSQRIEAVVKGDEQKVIADKAYASTQRSAWLEQRGIHNGILLRRSRRGQPLGEPAQRLNRFLSSVRCKVEKVFGHWKQPGIPTGRYVGWARSRLELEFKCVAWNFKRWVNVLAG